MKPFFAPLIRRWPTVVAFASEVGCPERSAREWLRIDSIPAAWFKAVALAAANHTGLSDINVDRLADLAERRRLSADRRQPRATSAAA